MLLRYQLRSFKIYDRSHTFIRAFEQDTDDDQVQFVNPEPDDPNVLTLPEELLDMKERVTVHFRFDGSST